MLYNKEIITLKMDTKKNKEKQKALIDAIISQRKESAKTISNIVHNIMESNISRKKFIFIKRIIIERKKSAIKIQTYFRSYIIQKKVKYYITKIRTCFAIESGFSQIFKNLQIIVLFNNKNKVFDLCYDKFFNKYIFYLERALVDKDTYKVQFINEGRIIIDSHYDTTEENGIYYNLIDFKKIREKEEKNLIKKNEEIKSICNYLKKKGIWIISQKSIDELNIKKIQEEIENNRVKSLDNLDSLNLEKSMRFVSPHKKQRSSSRLGNSGSSFIFHKKKSCLIKGILKMRASHERQIGNPGLKVKFGYIEFSY